MDDLFYERKCFKNYDFSFSKSGKVDCLSCDFSETNFNGADFSKIDENGKQIQANFLGCQFRCSLINGANMTSCVFKESCFYKASIQYSNLQFSDFSYCDFTFANLYMSNLKNTIFHKAVFHQTKIDRKNFEYLKEIRWDISESDFLIRDVKNE